MAETAVQPKTMTPYSTMLVTPKPVRVAAPRALNVLHARAWPPIFNPPPMMLNVKPNTPTPMLEKRNASSR
jgi:hypothetical protein